MKIKLDFLVRIETLLNVTYVWVGNISKTQCFLDKYIYGKINNS